MALGPRHPHRFNEFRAMGVLAQLFGITLGGGVGLAATFDWMEVAFIPVTFFLACVSREIFLTNHSTALPQTQSAKSYRNLLHHCAEHIGRDPAKLWVAIPTGDMVVFKSFHAILQLPKLIHLEIKTLLRLILEHLSPASSLTQLVRNQLACIELPLHSSHTSLILSSDRLLRGPPAHF